MIHALQQSVPVAHVNERGQTTLPLSRAQATELRALGVCYVQPGASSTEWVVGDVRAVGNIALDGLRLVIRPKVPLRSVLYMASVARMQVEVADTVFDVDEDQSVPAALAEAFVSALDAATSRGLIKGYVNQEESAMLVRGRWDVARQLRVRPGLPVPVELMADEFTEDVSENRILHTALRAILRLDDIPPDTTRRARQLTSLFTHVGTLRRGEQLPSSRQTRLNRHLMFSLFLGETLLRSAAWTQVTGAARAGTFLIDMARTFEGFIGEALRRALLPRHLAVELQDGHSWRFDTRGQIRLRPDIVVRSRDVPIAVADTKYKPWGDKPGSPPNADVYQAVAYALTTGLTSAHLIYVAGDVDPRRYEIESAGVTVVAHSLDLGGAPRELRQSIDQLIGGMLPLANPI